MPPDPLSLLSRGAFRARIAARALEDEEFRRELIQNPKTAIQGELGRILGRSVELGPDVQIAVHEENPASFHFVIPAGPASGAVEADAQHAEPPDDLLLFWERILRPAP